MFAPPDARSGTCQGQGESLRPLIATYDIPLEEFSTRPRTRRRFAFPDRVQRSNFPSYLIWNFSVAGGSVDIQRAACEWSYLNQGFDFRTTFSNYNEAGGLMALSRRERRDVMAAFRRVPRHEAGAFTYESLDGGISGFLDDIPYTNWELLTPPQALVGMPAKTLERVLKEERERRRLIQNLIGQAAVLRVSTYSEDPERGIIERGLLAYPTEITDREYREIEWSRGAIFLHALQDTRHAATYGDNMQADQACFVRDLRAYLDRFPRDQKIMKSVFETLLHAGTAARWHEDQELPRQLNPIFEELDEKIIRSWVQAEPVS